MLKIVKDTNPKLRRKCEPVETPLDDENEAIALSLLSYLKDSQDPEFLQKHPKVRSGVGLAAPQVGVSRRMIAVYFEDEDGKEVCHVLANPKILSSSVRQCYLAGGEGCLSVDVPHQGNVYRAYKITVSAYDVLSKKDVKLVARGYEAIVLQHEIDHLDGILFYDHIDHPDKSIDVTDAIRI